MKTAISVVAVLLAGFVIAPVLTFVLWPFWDWLEATYGIESLGHSGPAEWCFAAIYGLYLVVSLGMWLRLRRRKSSQASEPTAAPRR
jgi:hypothetical protein